MAVPGDRMSWRGVAPKRPAEWLIVLLLVVGLSWLLYQGYRRFLYEAPGQRVARTRIEAMGGSVERDPNRPGRPVVAVSLANMRAATDEHLAGLESFPELERLDLAHTPIGNPGLVHVRGLTRLRDLNLSYTAVTDQGLASLTGLVQLQRLQLAGTWLRGRGLSHLAGLGGLEELNLAESGVSDEVFPQLAKLPRLQRLYPSSTRVTGEGAGALNVLPDLRVLSLSDTMRVTSDGLRDIGRLTQLEELDVRQAYFGQRGLQHLHSLKALRLLDLRGTDRSDEELNGLHEALPNTRVLP